MSGWRSDNKASAISFEKGLWVWCSQPRRWPHWLYIMVIIPALRDRRSSCLRQPISGLPFLPLRSTHTTSTQFSWMEKALPSSPGILSMPFLPWCASLSPGSLILTFQVTVWTLFRPSSFSWQPPVNHVRSLIISLSHTTNPISQYSWPRIQS